MADPPPFKPASTRAHNVTNLPQQLLSAYSTFVRGNASQVSQVESSLRSLIYILPSRFHENPFAGEALQTALTLISALHTHILAPSANDPNYRASPHLRYENWAKASHLLYRRALTLLRTIQYTQQLIEMYARRTSDKARWRAIVTLECTKAICRFLMLYLTRRRVIGTESGGESQERRTDDHDTETDATVSFSASTPTGDLQESKQKQFKSTYTATGEWHMPRTGHTLPPLPPSPETYLDAHALQPDDIRPPPTLASQLRTIQAQTAETLWILRPVIYALVLQHYHSRQVSAGDGRRRQHWQPWFVGFSMEILSQWLAKRDIRDTHPGGLRGLAGVERAEMKRRDGGIVWWGMRGAFYECVTGPLVRRVGGACGKVPLVGGLVQGVVEDYDRGWTDWFYTTASS